MSWFEKNTKRTIGTVADLGEVKENAKYKIVYERSYQWVDKVVPGCGCTGAKLNEQGNVIASFETGKIPVHMRHLKKQNFKKSIVVHFANDTQETLYIIGTRKI